VDATLQQGVRSLGCFREREREREGMVCRTLCPGGGQEQKMDTVTGLREEDSEGEGDTTPLFQALSATTDQERQQSVKKTLYFFSFVRVCESTGLK
jgi:hypothetical protein